MPNLLATPTAAGSFEVRLRKVFWFLLGGLVVVSSGGAVSAVALASAGRDIDAVQDAIQLSSGIREGMIDQESGVRGFVLTGRDDFLDTYPRGGAAADEDRAMLREMADMLGGLVPLLTGLDEAIESWRAAANEEVALVRSGRQEEAIAIVGSGVPKERFDLVRQRSADLDEFLVRIVEARSARQNGLERWLAVGGAVVLVAGVVVVVSTHRWLVRSVTQPLATLTGAVAQGDDRPFDVVASGGAAREISALARSAEQFRSTKDRERHEAVLAAAQSERRRVVADLHDGPVQTLFALQLGLRRLGGRLRGRGDHDGAQVADEGVAVLESTQAQLRWMMFALAPPGLGHKPFVDVLEGTLPQILEPPARLRIDAPRDIEVDQSTQGTLCRVIVEAIRNVNKHAAASEVCILITPVGSTVDVEITDDGVGFEPDRAAAVDHVGLDIMRSMVESVDGTIEIVSAPGAGTRIHVVVPA